MTLKAGLFLPLGETPGTMMEGISGRYVVDMISSTKA
jgi:hypothetical protein